MALPARRPRLPRHSAATAGLPTPLSPLQNFKEQAPERLSHATLPRFDGTATKDFKYFKRRRDPPPSQRKTQRGKPRPNLSCHNGTQGSQKKTNSVSPCLSAPCTAIRQSHSFSKRLFTTDFTDFTDGKPVHSHGRQPRSGAASL